MMITGEKQRDGILRGRSIAAKAGFLLLMLLALAVLWAGITALVKNGHIQMLLYVLSSYLAARFMLRG